MSKNKKGSAGVAYRPTAAQEKLLQVMLDPRNRFLNKLELCKKAGVNKKVYYTAFKNPKFVNYYRSKARDLVSEAVIPIINSAIREAKLGSFNHIKMLLEMEDMHQDSLALTGPNKGPIVTADMDADTAARIFNEKIKNKKRNK